MKQGKIYLYNQYVGLLTEDETGFTPKIEKRKKYEENIIIIFSSHRFINHGLLSTGWSGKSISPI